MAPELLLPSDDAAINAACLRLLHLPRLRQGGELEQLIAQLPYDASVVEVGCFAGESTEQFLRSGRITKLTCVDNWTGGYDPADIASGADMPAAYLSFLLRTAGDSRLRVIHDSSEAAVKQLACEQFDMVYLDADHRYEQLCPELASWAQRVRPGGLLAGHDYGAAWPSVAQAVNEVLGVPDIVFPDTSWAKRL